MARRHDSTRRGRVGGHQVRPHRRRVAARRARDARVEAHDARRPRRPRRALQPALGRDRPDRAGLAGRAVGSRLRLGGGRRRAERPPRARDRGRAATGRRTALGERRASRQLRAELRDDLRRLCVGGRRPVLVGAPLADLERAESDPLAAPDVAGGVHDAAPQPRVRRDPRRDPGRRGRRRRDRSPRLDGRRLTRRLAARHACSPREARCLRPQPLSARPETRDTAHRWLQAVHDDHDGDDRQAGRPRRRATFRAPASG